MILRIAPVFVFAFAACHQKDATSPGGHDVTSDAPDASVATAPESAPSVSTASAASTPTSSSSTAGPAPSTIEADPCSLSASRYEATVKDDLNRCYREGRKDVPFLAGRLKVGIGVDSSGKGTNIHAEPSPLGDKVNKCAVAAVKAKPFFDIACKGKSLTLVRIYGKDE